MNNIKWSMKMLLLNRSFFILLAVGLSLMACDWIPFPRDTITISGTVTITRKKKPWIPDHSGFSENKDAQAVYETGSAARTSLRPLPHDRPRISANISSDERYFIGRNDADYPLNSADFNQGKYPWTMEIQSSYLPCLIYFEIEVQMTGLYPSKMTQGIWVENDNSIIDLGVIDFDVIQLWGNLPVTINDLTWSANEYSRLNRRPCIFITRADGSYLGAPDIGSNGNWRQDVYSQDSEIPLTFTLDAREKGGIFVKTLNPNHVITVYDTDKEIIFPDYPNVNFEAFTLSGTIDIIVTREKLNWLVIEFYDTDYSDDSLVGLVDMWNWQIPINENGLLEWKTMIPAFTFPKKLLFRTQYQIKSGIDITEETDLNNIFLGSFPDYTVND